MNFFLHSSIRDEFNHVLRDVALMFPGTTPVIGGGAVRDALLGKDIKDIDVFIRSAERGSLDHAATTRVACNSFVQQYGRKDMHGAWDLAPMWQHVFPIQLILADFQDQRDLADTFDLGLTRVTYTVDGGQYVTDAFRQDVHDKVFRIRRADNEMEFKRSLKRAKRIQEKYPDFTIDNPEESPKCFYLT